MIDHTPDSMYLLGLCHGALKDTPIMRADPNYEMGWWDAVPLRDGPDEEREAWHQRWAQEYQDLIYPQMT